jgi:hypothetical protein
LNIRLLIICGSIKIYVISLRLIIRKRNYWHINNAQPEKPITTSDKCSNVTRIKGEKTKTV